jgi:hypothetical protein
MPGTRASEKPARKHQNVNNASACDGMTKVMCAAAALASWGTLTNSMLRAFPVGIESEGFPTAVA